VHIAVRWSGLAVVLGVIDCSALAAAVAGRIAVVEHVAVFRAWLARAFPVAVVRNGLASRPATHAVHKQELQFREAKTVAVFVSPTTFMSAISMSVRYV
jgi:hypothetical protein